MFSPIFRGIFAALLLAGSSQLLAQQPDSGGRAVRAQAQPSAKPLNNLRELAPGAVFRDCAGCPELVVIPPGSVSVAAPIDAVGAGAEAPPRLLAISRAIAVGRYEVSRAQFARFVDESGHATRGLCFVWNGSKYEKDASKDWRNPGFAQTDSDPVVCVNWNDAKAYADWLSAKSGKAYRLPTEIEWEYAARAGSQAIRPWGDDARAACGYANVADLRAMHGVPGTVNWLFHDCDDKYAYTAPVGSYRANAFGLYDMLGNAWEWTEDCQDEQSTSAPAANSDCPKGACCRRALRGGGWVDSPDLVRYDFRFLIGSGDRDFYIGFRVLRAD